MGEHVSSWDGAQVPGYAHNFPQGHHEPHLTGGQSQVSLQQLDPLGVMWSQSNPAGVTHGGATVQNFEKEQKVHEKSERDVHHQASQSQSMQYVHSQAGGDSSGISGQSWQNTQNSYNQSHTEYDTQGWGNQFRQSLQNNKVDESVPDRGSSHSREHDQEISSGQFQGQNMPADIHGIPQDEHISTESRSIQGVHHTQQDMLDNYSKTTPTGYKSYSEAVKVHQCDTELKGLSHTHRAISGQTGEKPQGQGDFGLKGQVDNVMDRYNSKDVQLGGNSDVQLIEVAVQTETVPVKTVMVELPVAMELQKKHAHCYSQEEYQKLLENFTQVMSDTLNKHELELCEVKQHYTKQIDDLSNRLSTEMNSKISSNETAIENISIKDRPTKIAEEYSGHCTTQWLEAKQYLDDTFPNAPDPSKLKFLCDVLTVSGKIALILQRESENRIHQYFSDPLNMSENPVKDVVKEQLPQEMKNTISDMMRVMSSKVDVKRIVKGIQEELLKKWNKVPALIYDVHIVPYIEKSAQLAWKMANQRPVMTLHTTGIGERFVDIYQEPQWGSSDPNDCRSVVHCYVHPALAHGDKLLVKGKVYLQPKGKTGQ